MNSKRLERRENNQQTRTNEKVEIVNEVIFSNKCCCEPELAAGMGQFDAFAKTFCRSNMDFIQQQQAPLWYQRNRN